MGYFLVQKIIIDYLSNIAYHCFTTRQRQVVKTRNGGLTNLSTESEVMSIERLSKRSLKTS